MPFTPYHFGPNGFVGLIFNKHLDLPVIVLANVVIDLEVLVVLAFDLGRPIHRYCHTLLIGSAVGALFGFLAWLLLRGVFKFAMKTIRLDYKPTLPKMIFSGALGAAMHVAVDALYHVDVKIFWPSRYSLWRNVVQYIREADIKSLCLILIAAAALEYILTLVLKKITAKNAH